jgi:predicted ABC-type ATPase
MPPTRAGRKKVVILAGPNGAGKQAMKTKQPAPDRDMAGVRAALVRAAAAARRLSEQTNTPFYVLENGRVVDLNARRASRRRRSAPRRA